MKYLFITWDGGGNLSPELAVARSLVGRGHEVHFLGHRSQAGAIEHAGCGFTAYERAPDCDQSRPSKALIKDWNRLRLQRCCACRWDATRRTSAPVWCTRAPAGGCLRPRTNAPSPLPWVTLSPPMR